MNYKLRLVLNVLKSKEEKYLYFMMGMEVLLLWSIHFSIHPSRRVMDGNKMNEIKKQKLYCATVHPHYIEIYQKFVV